MYVEFKEFSQKANIFNSMKTDYNIYKHAVKKSL